MVEATEDEAIVRFFLAPEGGGTRLRGGVLLVTPRSPPGAWLLGACVGDEVEVEVTLAGQSHPLAITRVR